MSQENVETGRLLCAIPNASKSVWTPRSFDLLLFEHAVAAIRVTVRESWRATFKDQLARRGSGGAQMRRLGAKAARPVGELLAERPVNLLLPKARIQEIEARQGPTTVSTLRLMLDDGQELEWKYGSRFAPPFDEIEAAVQQLRGGPAEAAGLRE